MNYVFRFILVFLLSVGLIAPQPLFAQADPVTAAELRDAVRRAAGERQKNLEQVRSFFADPKVRSALQEGRIDAGRLEKAVAALDSAELAKLAARTQQIQKDFAAGALTNQELTYIVIALGVAVLILIVVVD